MEQSRILIAEDDVDINRLLTDILRKEGYEIDSAFSGSEAKLRAEMKRYDLVLLDLMMPGLTGEALIEELRKNQTMPMIVISAKSAMVDRIHVLELGADDFVQKPFDVHEIVARVAAQLRRYQRFGAPAMDGEKNLLTFKNLRLNRETVEVLVKGEPLALTAREFAILELLMTYPKKVFTKENLFAQVWNDAYYGGDNTVNVHMSNIRSKLAKLDPENEYIKTVWGIGFKMAD